MRKFSDILEATNIYQKEDPQIFINNGSPPISCYGSGFGCGGRTYNGNANGFGNYPHQLIQYWE